MSRTSVGLALKALSILLVLATGLFLLTYVGLATPDEFDEGPFNWAGFILTAVLVGVIGFGAAFVLRRVAVRLMAPEPTERVTVSVGAPQPSAPEVTEEWNDLALWALVTALGSVLIPMLGIVAFILGIVARNQLRERSKLGLPAQRGRWMAIAAIFLGAATVAVYVVLGILAAT